MDGRRFDAWTRGLAGTSRRGALRVLAGGLLATPLALVGGRDAAAQIVECGRRGDVCVRERDCCSGFDCRRGICRRDRDECGKRGDPCSRHADCCEGFRCRRRRGVCRRERN